MRVAALVRIAAAEIDPVALLIGDRRAVDNILGPLRRGPYPLNQFARVLVPLRILVRMQQHVARKLQRNHLVHVAHRGHRVLKVAHPHVVREWVLLEPLPGRVPRLLVLLHIALLNSYEFIE